MINQRIKVQDSSDEDEVEKEAAFLAKNFRKFLKFKKDGKSFEKEKFSNFNKDKKDFKRKDSKDSSPSQVTTCYECNEHGHLKKERLTYLIRIAQTPTLKKAMMEKETTPLSWPLHL